MQAGTVARANPGRHGDAGAARTGAPTGAPTLAWSLRLLLCLSTVACGRTHGLTTPSTDAAPPPPTQDAPSAAGGNAGSVGPGSGQGGSAGGPVASGRASGGTGGSSTPSTGSIKVSPSLLDFGTVDVGVTSTVQVVTVTVASGTVTLNPTVVGAGFALGATTCAASQGPGTCTIRVTFAPVAIGGASGVLTVGSSLVSLSGIGLWHSTFATPDKIDFGTLFVNTPMTMTLPFDPSPATGFACTAAGADLTAESQTCPPRSEDPGTTTAPCLFTFTFKAATPGTKSESVVCSGGGKTTVTSVTATVVTRAAPVIAPATGQFTAAVGETAVVTFSVANNGGSTSGYLAATISTGAADFSIVSNECVVPLSPLAVCKIQIAFKPTTLGAKTGALSVTDGNGGASIVAPLTGTTSDTSPVILSPGSVDFGAVTVGASSTTVSLTLKNSSGLATEVLHVETSSPDFAIGSDSCTGRPIAAGADCSFAVVFTPTGGPGQELATVLVSAERSGALLATAKMRGLVVAPSGRALTLTPPALDFKPTAVGVPVGPLAFTVVNTGDATTGELSVVKNDSPSSVGGTAQFGLDTTCVGALAPGAACLVRVTFKATMLGLAAATLTITDGTVSTAAGSVTGTAVTSEAPSFDCGSFAATPVGRSSLPVTCTAKVYGLDGGIPTITTAASGDFAVTGQNCSPTECTVTLVFKPTASGSRTGSLTVMLNATVGNVRLGGTGL